MYKHINIYKKSLTLLTFHTELNRTQIYRSSGRRLAFFGWRVKQSNAAISTTTYIFSTYMGVNKYGGWLYSEPDICRYLSRTDYPQCKK